MYPLSGLDVRLVDRCALRPFAQRTWRRVGRVVDELCSLKSKNEEAEVAPDTRTTNWSMVAASAIHGHIVTEHAHDRRASWPARMRRSEQPAAVISPIDT